MSERQPMVDPDGCGCAIAAIGFALAAVILATAIADGISKCGWPW